MVRTSKRKAGGPIPLEQRGSEDSPQHVLAGEEVHRRNSCCSRASCSNRKSCGRGGSRQTPARRMKELCFSAPRYQTLGSTGLVGCLQSDRGPHLHFGLLSLAVAGRWCLGWVGYPGALDLGRGCRDHLLLDQFLLDHLSGGGGGRDHLDLLLPCRRLGQGHCLRLSLHLGGDK